MFLPTNNIVIHLSQSETELIFNLGVDNVLTAKKFEVDFIAKVIAGSTMMMK